MQSPSNPQSLRWTMIHYSATGAFGHIQEVTAAGLPVVKFVGCNTSRICMWDEIELGQKVSDP